MVPLFVFFDLLRSYRVLSLTTLVSPDPFLSMAFDPASTLFLSGVRMLSTQ